jgi:hypothetical protein
VPGTEYDRLAVSGPVLLNGVLTIESGPGFLPPLGTTFDIVTGPRSGQFAAVEGGALPNGTSYVAHYNPSSVQLVVDPIVELQGDRSGVERAAGIRHDQRVLAPSGRPGARRRRRAMCAPARPA